MYKKCLIGIIVMHSVISCCAQFQDHVILWDASNWRFKEGHNEIIVIEGDNLIFVCPSNRTFSQSLYWTNDSRVTIKCNQTLPIKVTKLLDCFGDNYATEFILKVSRFHEISSLPVFHQKFPIHFLAQSVICQNSNFRLSVKLASTQTTTSTDTVSNDFVRNTKLTDHDEKSTTLNKSSYFLVKPKITKFITNVSSSSYLNHDFTSTQQTNWKEYRFLILPATLAVFTLVGMQIVICSFWLPISGINKFFKHFRKCKRLQNSESHHESKTLKVDNGNFKMTNQSLCWSKPTQTAVNYCTKHALKRSFSNCYQLTTSNNQSERCKLLHQSYQSDFNRQKNQFQDLILLKSLIDRQDYFDRNINQPVLHETSNVSCNCFHQQHQIIMQLNKNQTNIVPIFIPFNRKLHENFTSTQTISELV
ncbi:unnamed protein product [Schistosoma turkestanicum]|nr:unnamed protein product [Schistosoma turkestanicum]